MRKILLSLLIILVGGFSAMSQLITFDDQGHVNGTSYGNPYSIVNNGETFVFTLSGGSPTSHIYRTSETFCANSGFNHMTAGAVPQTTWTIETLSGNEIDLGTIDFDNYFTCSAFNYDLTIQGFKNGTPTGTQTFSVTPGFGNVFNSNASFNDVDEIVISASDLQYLGIDNINWTPIAPPCTNPTVPTLTSTPTTVCAGGSATLNITGTLNDATQWAVYTGSCGGTLLGTTTTSSFNVTPSANTTYYVRGEGGCVTGGSCGTVSINVTNVSLTPASQTNVSCFGGSNGAAAVNNATGGTTPYTYNWTPGNPTGDGTTSVTGLSAGTWTCTVTDANSCTATQTFTVTQPSALNATAISQTNIACFGGSTGAASVSASGGAGGYSYNWTPGNPTGDGTASVTGLSAGSWTCTVTDANSCTAARTFTLTQSSAISLTAASQTNIACFGGATGAAAVNAATGGSGGYSYNWTPGNPTGDGTTSVTGLSAGSWTCTVTDANSCTASQTFTVTQPSALNATAVSQTNVSCFGGSNGAAAVSASGGAGGYSYNWTPGNPTGDGTASVTGLSAGSWTCTVTDANSCTATRTFTVTQPSALNATAVSQTNVSCFGGSNGAAAISASGGAGGYTYNWTPGNPTGDGTASVTGLSAGTWTCTVTDANSCTATQAFTVTQPTTISLTAASQTNIACFGGSTGAAAVNAATGGAGGYTYNWTPGNPTGDGTVSVTGLSAGSWTCTVTDANSCTASQTFTVTQPSAISLTAASQTNIACFGGATGAAAVNAATGGAGGYTYNWTPGNPTGDGTVSVTGLSAGSWTCTVTDANSCTASQTFTVTQPSAISLTAASQTNIACFGGSTGAAAVNAATGGAGGYTYNWTPGNPTGDGTVSVTGLSAGSWTCTVTDANSCTASQTFTVTQPTALGLTPLASAEPTCGSADGSASVNAATGGAGGYTYDWTPGNPTGDGTTSVTGLAAGTWTCTVTDANSCTASTSFTLNPVDITPPTAVCQDISVYLDGSGNASINASDLDGGSTDDCGGVTLSASQTAFACSDLNIISLPSANLVITGVYDGPLTGGTPKGVELYVLNDIADLSLYGLGSANNGGGTNGQEFTFPAVAATAGTFIYVSSESTEFTNYFGFAPDYTDVSMGVNGDDAVELFFNGSVLDVFGDINIDGTGQAWEYLDGWAYRTNNSGPDASTFVVSNWTYSGINAMDNETSNSTAVTPFPLATFSYSTGSAPVAVTLTVTDGGGNSSTCTANVSVLDTISPVVTCPGDQTESPSASCDFTLPDYTGLATGSDNCGVVTLVQSPAAGTVISGTTLITMTATDASGNIGTCSFNVALDDVTPPTATCQNVDAYLNGAGTASIVAADIDGGSVDNCAGLSLSASQTAFSCADIGANNVTLTVTDGNSNSSTCTAVVTVIDTIAPVAICQNITAYLDGSGTAIVFSGQVDGGSVDNCSIAGTSSSPAIFSCANLGTNNVTFTVTDGSGNTESCTSVVTIVDTISPVPSSPTLADVTAACSVTSLTDPSATDNCGSITVTNNAVLPINTAGTTVVTWTYTDDSGNSVSQDQNVIITNSTTTGVDTQVHCDSYTWIDANTYTSSNNTATFTLTNAAGCDSIVTLNLTINNSTTGVDTRTACNSFTWIDGITYTSSNNTATFTLMNAAGCDSVVTLNLTINNSNTGVDTQVQCDSYTWIDGITYTSSNNTATFTLMNAAGCDSVVTLDLTINSSSTGVDTRTACNSFTWIDGITYTSSNNTATFTLTNAANCDSVVTLDLTILTEVFSNISDVGCDSYTWAQNGMTYTTSGIYSDTIVGGSVNGCDSIIVLDLTINQSSSSVDVVNECDSYTWIDGNTYTASNNSATVVFTNAAGCDSIVTLNLTLGFSTTSTEVVSVCDPSYTWAANGTTYTSSGTYTAVLTSVEGCDSTVTLDLELGGGIDLTVTQAGETLIASQFVADYQWIDCSTNQPIPGETGQSFSPSTSGSYAVIITDNNCTDTSACVNITVTGLDELDSDKVTIYPNPSSGNEVTFVYDGNISNVQVFDVVGRSVISASKLVNNKLDVSNLSYGKYIVKISTESSVVTKELIIAR